MLLVTMVWDADSTAGAGANDATTVGSAYGDTVATTAGANDASESTLEFAAKSFNYRGWYLHYGS
ncbi:MAG: hypothetical protein R3B12_04355 [Candidatus Saccharimonadales bacterium]